MNTTIFRQFLARMSDRTKMIAIAIIAFGAGSLLTGSGGNGRYVPFGNSGEGVLDTRTGTMWILDGHDYKRAASFSYF